MRSEGLNGYQQLRDNKNCEGTHIHIQLLLFIYLNIQLNYLTTLLS